MTTSKDLPDWTFYVREESIGVYRSKAVDSDGHVVERVDVGESGIDEVRAKIRQLFGRAADRAGVNAADVHQADINGIRDL